MGLIALAIRLDSPGPVLFKQTRVGKGGQEFECWKFRSMREGAEAEKERLLELNEATGPLFKIKEDPRVTRVGRLLRRFSLDELPQFYNVLRGEMSLVGPRPPLPTEVAQYQEWHKQRLEAPPGPHRPGTGFGPQSIDVRRNVPAGHLSTSKTIVWRWISASCCGRCPRCCSEKGRIDSDFRLWIAEIGSKQGTIRNQKSEIQICFNCLPKTSEQ